MERAEVKAENSVLLGHKAEDRLSAVLKRFTGDFSKHQHWKNVLKQRGRNKLKHTMKQFSVFTVVFRDITSSRQMPLTSGAYRITDNCT